MKQLLPIMFRSLFLGLALLSLQLSAQNQSKTYSENFNVGDDAVLDINTSYADIVFETWDKNQVSVEATIELEGASMEEATEYFENSGIKILGNSKTIEISTYGQSHWPMRIDLGGMDLENMVIEIPEMPDMELLFRDLAIPDLPEMPEIPPIPPIPKIDFDYDAYKKDGEKYMKKWQKEFNKKFDAKYQKRMEEWGKEFQARAEARKEMMEEQREAMEENREAMRDQRKEVRNQAQELREKAMADRERAREMEREVRRNVLIERAREADAPDIFYRSKGGESINFKVKKTIKIKMPKSAKLKMNVRHGEVKLAANTRNMNATLSHTRLLAATIDGDKTYVKAAYSPVNVEVWNYGKLSTSFSDEVILKAVNHLNLNATSSDVTIHKLLKNLYGKNNLGVLNIKGIDKNFMNLDLDVQNGELICVLPEAPFVFDAISTYSDYEYPETLRITKKDNKQNVTYSGYFQNQNAVRAIKLNTAYSNIILK